MPFNKLMMAVIGAVFIGLFLPISEATASDVQYAVIMITKDGCGYCVKQRKVLSEDSQKLPFQIREINISQRPDILNRFVVHVTPTIILLASYTSEYVVLTTGVESVDYIIDRARLGINHLESKKPQTEQYLM